ncbi:unnamed protein product, partial [marine sediment metagenome]
VRGGKKAIAGVKYENSTINYPSGHWRDIQLHHLAG